LYALYDDDDESMVIVRVWNTCEVMVVMA